MPGTSDYRGFRFGSEKKAGFGGDLDICFFVFLTALAAFALAVIAEFATDGVFGRSSTVWAVASINLGVLALVCNSRKDRHGEVCEEGEGCIKR